jgi:hypothetical protein
MLLSNIKKEWKMGQILAAFLEYLNITGWGHLPSKVQKILKGNLDLILSPSPSVKIQITDGKICGVKVIHCWVLSTNI